jgi:hypothetical protein
MRAVADSSHPSGSRRAESQWPTALHRRDADSVGVGLGALALTLILTTVDVATAVDNAIPIGWERCVIPSAPRLGFGHRKYACESRIDVGEDVAA